MQYGFGDSSRPLKETAECVENILHEQLIQILQLLCQNCHQESREIRIEDFLFLLRHSPVKLRKFCQYLQVKDLKKNFIKSGAVDKPSCELNPLTDSGGESKQLAAALIFLNDIDPTGFLASVADPNCDCSLHDEMLQERISRIDRMTISMDIQQYMEYSKVYLNLSILNIFTAIQACTQHELQCIILPSGQAEFIWKASCVQQVQRLAAQGLYVAEQHSTYTEIMGHSQLPRLRNCRPTCRSCFHRQEGQHGE